MGGGAASPVQAPHSPLKAAPCVEFLNASALGVVYSRRKRFQSVEYNQLGREWGIEMRTIACFIAFALSLGCRELIEVTPKESLPPPEGEVSEAVEPEPEQAEPKEVFWTGLVSVSESVRDYDKECDERGDCCYFWPTQTSYPEVSIGSVDLSDYEEAWVTWEGDPAELLAGFSSMRAYSGGDISELCGKGSVKLVAQFRLEFPAGEYCTIAQAAFESHTRKSAKLNSVKVYAR